MKSKYLCVFPLLIFCSCVNNTISLENEKRGKLTATYCLALSGEKRIHLDYETAPQPPYMQMFQDVNGKQMLTLLNPYKNAIYFYDYEEAVYIRKIEYDNGRGPNSILRLAGYYIKNMDSIYVFNNPMMELALTDSLGRVKQRISLRDNRTDQEWSVYYPQYYFMTINPIIENNGKLILTGMSPFGATDSLFRKFQISCCVDLKTGYLDFMHNYPPNLYGSNGFQWQEPAFMQSYRELSPSGEFIYSFPVSHHLYIASYGFNEYKTVYAGSNFAGTIRSLGDDKKNIPNEVIRTHFLQYDFYSAILYDPYRHVYYRFMLQGIPDAAAKNQWKIKPVVVIIMDEQFNYLGETLIGTGEEWKYDNSFVTSDGLVVEYIDQDADSEEAYLILKTFTVEKINK